MSLLFSNVVEAAAVAHVEKLLQLLAVGLILQLLAQQQGSPRRHGVPVQAIFVPAAGNNINHSRRRSGFSGLGNTALSKREAVQQLQKHCEGGQQQQH
jgi:hypothetical protein